MYSCPIVGYDFIVSLLGLPVKSLEAFDRGFPGIVFWDAPFHQSIASQGATMELSQAGIFLSIPAQALSSAEKDVDLFIHPCFNGPFELPAGYESASPTYLIQPSSKVKFDRDATLQIHHYASLQSEEDCEEMAFLYSSPKPQYRQSKPVYSFNKFERSSEIFRPNSHVGEIKLQHFCLITIGRKRKVNSQTGVNNSKKGTTIYLLYLVVYSIFFSRLLLFCPIVSWNLTTMCLSSVLYVPLPSIVYNGTAPYIHNCIIVTVFL